MAAEDASSPLSLPTIDQPLVLWQSQACQSEASGRQQAILPGSFNPLHYGHRQLRAAAQSFLDQPVTWELSIRNVDKPRLEHHVVQKRLQQMDDEAVFLTEAPLFTEKARLFPDSWFVIGFDTAVRILDPRYYQNSHQQRDQALAELQECHVRFLVAGRVTSSDNTRFHTHQDLQLDSTFAELFVELPEHQFRADISSTQLRDQPAEDQP